MATTMGRESVLVSYAPGKAIGDSSEEKGTRVFHPGENSVQRAKGKIRTDLPWATIVWVGKIV